MIDPQDLRAGVAAGIVTEAQAASLSALAHSRAGARETVAAGDEPFELFKGFNEIFIVVGLGILAIGWAGVAAMFTFSDDTDPAGRALLFAGVGAVILWGLSEYFVRRRRMVAPAIALTVLFGLNALLGSALRFSEPFMVAQADYVSLTVPFAVVTLAMSGYWLRFKVPFAMAMIALGLFATALVMAADQAGTPGSFSDLFLLSAGGPFAWITLALGIAVFCVALWFDMSDPYRVTRRSANGFWLHLVAAPALVNTVALSLLSHQQIGWLLGFLALIAVVAIVIDRRSFLIAGVGYSVTLSATVFDAEGSMFTVLALGVFLVLLGAFWERIRGVLLRMMPFLPLHRFPPSVVRTHD